MECTTIEKLVQRIKDVDKQYDLDKIMQAYTLADNAHEGQVRSSGDPYISHPLAVASILLDYCMDTDTIVAALLHDVVEDTAVTLEELAREFPEEVVEVVRLLTHEDSADSSNSDYFSYLLPIKAHPIAKKVKLADIAHNSDQSRCAGSGLTEEQLSYWKQKYQKAIEILSE